MRKNSIVEMMKNVGGDRERLVQLCTKQDKYILIIKASDQSLLIIDNTAWGGNIVKATGFFEGVKMVDRLYLLGKKHKIDRCQLFIVCNHCEGEMPFCISTNSGITPLANVFLVADNFYDDCLEAVVISENGGKDCTYSLATAHSRDEGYFFLSLMNFLIRLLDLYSDSQNILDRGVLKALLLGSAANDD